MNRRAEAERLGRNAANTLGLAFFQVFLVFMPVAVPFFQSRGLDMQQIFVLQAIFATVVLVTEVPSGYLADLLGRKPTLLVGAVLAGVGHTLLVFADGFVGLMLFEIALGVSSSLISGADIALLYDSEAALGRDEDDQRQVVGRLYAIRTLSEAAAAVACSVLLLVSMELVVYAQAVVGWIPLLLALRLAEPPVARLQPMDQLRDGPRRSGHLRNLGRICRQLLAQGAVLRLTFLALCIWSLSTFYAVWLIQQLWQLHGVNLMLFGYLWAGLCAAAALAGRWAHALEARFGSAGVLVTIGLLPAFGYLGLDLLGPVGAFFASCGFFVARGMGVVILSDALNRRVPASYRATANSLASFGFRGAFVITGPLVGQALTAWGMSATLWLLTAAALVIFAGLILPLVAAVRAQQAAAGSP